MISTSESRMKKPEIGFSVETILLLDLYVRPTASHFPRLFLQPGEENYLNFRACNRLKKTRSRSSAVSFLTKWIPCRLPPWHIRKKDLWIYGTPFAYPCKALAGFTGLVPIAEDFS